MLKLEAKKLKNNKMDKERVRLDKDLNSENGRNGGHKSSLKSNQKSGQKSSKKGGYELMADDERISMEDNFYGSGRFDRDIDDALPWEDELTQDSNNESYTNSISNPHFNSNHKPNLNYNPNHDQEKKSNKKLGKLGKISKLERSYSIDMGSEEGEGKDNTGGDQTPGGSMNLLMRAVGSVGNLEVEGEESNLSLRSCSPKKEESNGHGKVRVRVRVNNNDSNDDIDNDTNPNPKPRLGDLGLELGLGLLY